MPASPVITGLGVTAPNGLGTQAFWSATLAGHSGIRPLTYDDAGRYPVRLAGQITDFVAERHLPSRLLPQTDRVTRLALTAADWALADAAVSTGEIPEYEMGVVTSNASGGFEFTHREIRKLWTQGPEHVSVYESFAWFYAVNTGQISIRHGIRGPGGVLVGEQAGGLDAIGQARRLIGNGSRLVVTGGMESSFDPWGWVSHLAVGRLSHETVPERAYLPFDANASGYLPGEGGAILVLEDPDSARARGHTRCYGRITGYAATFDPPPGSDRPPGLARAITAALADAQRRPEQIDVVFADAAGVPRLDSSEAEAIAEVFGPYAVPVTAPKALIGRLLSGAGPIDLVCALLAIRDGVIPATPGIRALSERHRIDLVRGHPRSARISNALVLARGVGGFNAAVVVQAPHDSPG